MWRQALGVVFVALLGRSLLAFDHLLGGGFMEIMQTLFCKCFCFVKRTIRNQLKSSEMTGSTDFSAIVFILEILALLCTMLLLNRYKRHSIERTSKVLKKEPSELLEIKRRRQVNRSMDFGPHEMENPQLIKPLNLEIPLLQMAIIGTKGTTRSQPERGDASDLYNITDSAILSVATLLDKDFKLQESLLEDGMVLGDRNTVQFIKNRYLWDVIEEE